MSTTSQRYFDGKSIANDENRAHTVSLLLDYAIEKRLCDPGNTKQMETKGWKSAVQDLHDNSGYLSSFKNPSDNNGKAYTILRKQFTIMVNELAAKKDAMGRNPTANVLKGVKLHNDQVARKEKGKERTRQKQLEATLGTTLDNTATNHGLRHESLMGSSAEPNQTGVNVTPTTTSTVPQRDGTVDGRLREMPEQAGPYAPNLYAEVSVSAQTTGQTARDFFRGQDSNTNQRRRTTEEGNYVSTRRTNREDNIAGIIVDNDIIGQQQAIFDDLARQGMEMPGPTRAVGISNTAGTRPNNTALTLSGRQGNRTEAVRAVDPPVRNNQTNARVEPLLTNRDMVDRIDAGHDIVNQSLRRIQTIVDEPGRGTIQTLAQVTHVINQMDNARINAGRLVHATGVLTTRFLQEVNIEIPPHLHHDNREHIH